MNQNEFHVSIKHCFLMGKKLKLNNGLKSVTGKIPHRKQSFADGMQILNAVEQTRRRGAPRSFN